MSVGVFLFMFLDKTEGCEDSDYVMMADAGVQDKVLVS